MENKYYTDIDYNLTLNVLSNDISVKYDLNAIAQSIKNIVAVTKGEKIFDSNFGSDANFLDYSILLPFQLEIIKMRIFGELQLQEPRAIVQNIDIMDDNLGSRIITVSFSPIFDKNLIKTVVVEMQ
jgi:phage baseplate assembly protein W